MNKIDMVCKETKILVNSIKDLTEVNVVNALKENTAAMTGEQVTNLLQVISLSIEEGYDRSYSVFRKSVETSLTEKKSGKDK
jgi:hypothetical protein